MTIDILHLLWIVPIAAMIGFITAAILSASKGDKNN